MPSMTKIALAAAIVLSATLTASAATEHRRAQNHAPTYYAAPPIISDACQPVGPPCRTHPDGW
jgi:uncharacterized membrane protein